MAALSQCRALAGCKAFTGVRPTRRARVSNGTKVFMKTKDSYMVEVEVAEDEPEDIAVRRYMKQVMQSRVVEKLRARRVKETKIEEYKRRFRERCEARKLGLVEPTWQELYGADMEPKPFDEFFEGRDEGDVDGQDAWSLSGGPDDIFGTFNGGGVPDSQWGMYMDPANGGYMPGYEQFPKGNANAGWNPAGGYMAGNEQLPK